MLVQCHLTSLRGFTAYTKQAGTRSAGSATLHCGAVALHVATKLLELLTWIYLGAMLGSLTLTLWHPLQGAQREGKHSWKEQLATLQKQINPDYQPPAQSVDSPAEQLDSPAFIGELDSDESFDGSDLGEEDTFNLAMETGSSTSLADAGWEVGDVDDGGGDEQSDWAVLEEISEPKPQPPQKGKSIRYADRAERWHSSPALQSVPADVLEKLHRYQDEADTANAELAKELRRKKAAEASTHKRLRIISGHVAGCRLVSGKGQLTRPMMERVRAATFDMLLSYSGSVVRLPQGSRWLDLFAGTGSIGLEALSRGAEECHFVEMDHWVTESVLRANLRSCRMEQQSVVHTMKAEQYLEHAKSSPQYATSFDFISMCPPYLKVSYEELFGLLEGSPLVHGETYIVVEYPSKPRTAVPETIGPLTLIRDRKYGRTNLAVFGPA